MRPLNILVVDDHTGFRELIRELLGSCAAVLHFGVPHFIECSSAEEALVRAAQTAPDLITMDLHLPGMDGNECVRRLRPAMPRAVILMITHLRDQAVYGRALRAGVDAVVSKDDLSLIPVLVRECLAPGRSA
jgi:two-component system chemotaxis response regulator CheB